MSRKPNGCNKSVPVIRLFINELHAERPVELLRRPILNHTRPGEACYDPFLGSGSALIAAESTGRICYGMDIDPKYVDVAILRWQRFSGQEAVLDADGRTFVEIARVRQREVA